MAISGNPKKIAEDISEGYQSLNEASMKKYTPQDLKIILTNLQIVQRELRCLQVTLDDSMAIKAKNMKMSRVNQAMTMLQAYAKRRSIPL